MKLISLTRVCESGVLKRGLDVEHPIAGDELRAIKRYMASRPDALPWLFISERGQPFTRQSVNYLIAEAAARPGCRQYIRTCCGTLRLLARQPRLRPAPDPRLPWDALSPGVFTLKATKLLPFWSVGHFQPLLGCPTCACLHPRACGIESPWKLDGWPPAKY